MKNDTMIISILKFQWINLCISSEDCEFNPCCDIKLDYFEEQIAEEILLENSYTPKECSVPPKHKVYTE